MTTDIADMDPLTESLQHLSSEFIPHMRVDDRTIIIEHGGSQYRISIRKEPHSPTFGPQTPSIPVFIPATRKKDTVLGKRSYAELSPEREYPLMNKCNNYGASYHSLYPDFGHNFSY
jgi:hemin uptake protein HemP